MALSLPIHISFVHVQSAATSRFLDWLTNLTIHSESEFQPKLDSTSNGGREKKKARIVLCGHRYVFLLFLLRE